MAASIGDGIMALARAANGEKAVKAMAWNVILMVSGVTVLIAILEKKGGMDLFTTILARFSTQTSVTGVMGFVTGLISLYSSSSGIVLPTFNQHRRVSYQNIGVDYSTACHSRVQ